MAGYLPVDAVTGHECRFLVIIWLEQHAFSNVTILDIFM